MPAFADLCGLVQRLGFGEINMRTLFLILLMVVASMAWAESQIEVMPELAKQANAYTTENHFPWHTEIQDGIDLRITAKLNNIVPLVRTTHGDYHHTLYRVRFHSVQVQEGNFDAEELTFYLERKFPTAESGIKLKELWPFHKGITLTFKGKLVEDKLHILTIEKQGQQKDAPERK